MFCMFVVLRSPPSPSFFKSVVYQRDSSPPQKVQMHVYSTLLNTDSSVHFVSPQIIPEMSLFLCQLIF